MGKNHIVYIFQLIGSPIIERKGKEVYILLSHESTPTIDPFRSSLLKDTIFV